MSLTTDAPVGEFQGHTSAFQWVNIAEVQICPLAQRDYDPGLAAQIAADFSPAGFGFPVISVRGGVSYVVDGQHRIAAKKIRDEDDEKILCECFTGLSEQQEAELFLLRNHRKSTSVFDKFRIGLTAGRKTEAEINDVVTDAGCRIAISSTAGSIRAVGTLRQIHKRAGSQILGQTLRIIHNSFGDTAFHAVVMSGMSLVLQRYADQIDELTVTQRLMEVRGGVNSIVNKAEALHKQTNNAKGHCVAAVLVDTLNTTVEADGTVKPLPPNDRRRLTPWFRKRR